MVNCVYCEDPIPKRIKGSGHDGRLLSSKLRNCRTSTTVLDAMRLSYGYNVSLK